MDHKTITSQLLEFGISLNESEVYLAMLGKGEMKVAEISRKSEVKRTTVYSILESLKQKGLVYFHQRGFKMYFSAESPEQLKLILEHRKSSLNSLLPFLSDLFTKNTSTSLIKVYEGTDSLRNISEQILAELQNKDEYLVMGNIESWDGVDKNYFQRFVEKRRKVNVVPRILLVDSEKAREYKSFQKNYSEEVKIFTEKFDLNLNVLILKDKAVLYTTSGKLHILVIESLAVVSLLKNMFNIIWNVSR